jgi:hypothetical protein
LWAFCKDYEAQPGFDPEFLRRYVWRHLCA